MPSPLGWLRANLFSPTPSDILRNEERRLLRLVRRLPIDARAKVQGGVSRALIGEPVRINTPKGPLSFAVLGETSALRAKGLLTKQKATIAWIDTFQPQSVFWDIGANVGSYTLYAALNRDISVVAFEPAAVNYFLLATNCELNALGERVDCLQLGVGKSKSVGHLELSQLEAAASFSFRQKGKFPVANRQAALIVSVDELIGEYGLACPNYIKIDVPSLTNAIVEGASRTLPRPELRELHIETDEHSKDGRKIVEMLEQHGFVVAGRHVRGTTDLTFARPR